VTRSYACNNWFIFVSWFFWNGQTGPVCQIDFSRLPVYSVRSYRLIHSCDMPRLPLRRSKWRWCILPLSMRHHTHMNESSHNESFLKYKWVMSHRWMNHGIHANFQESFHTCEVVMSRIWIMHSTQIHESCYAYEWIVSYRVISNVTQMNGPCHTDE